MARSGVTYNEVSNAAQQLVSAGKTPTIESIRIILGTGSNSTLGTHLKAWKASQDLTQQIAVKEKLPEEMVSTMKGLWQLVMNQAEDKIQTIKQNTKQEVEELAKEMQGFRQESGHWQQQYQLIKKEKDGLFQEKQVLVQLAYDAKIEIASWTEKYAGIEKQIQEKQAHINELQKQNQQIQANLEHYRESVLEQRLTEQNRYEQQQRQFEQTIQQLNQDISNIKQESADFKQQSQQMRIEKDGLQVQLDKLIERYEDTEGRLAKALNVLAKKEEAQNHREEQYNALSIKWDGLSKGYGELKIQAAVVQQQAETTKAELEEVRRQNKVLANEKWELGQEKAKLYGQLKQFESMKLSK